ncbi:MAG: hypothetical protein NT033_05370 [Candidatus Omnitrophica bacterium]|nr:hypothetical protein [Candidatus Omnitrophota bacterium]
MKNLKVIFIAFLIGITAVCVFEYLALLRDKSVLQGNLKNAESELTVLQQERQKLLQELEKEKQRESQLEGLRVLYKDNLRAAGRKIFASVRLNEDISSRINIFKLENSVLRKRQIRLNQRIGQLEQENEDFRLKFSSLSELKKAIRILRHRPRKEEEEMIQKTPTRKIIEGNRGYLVKDGKLTFPREVNIEVIPYNKQL